MNIHYFHALYDYHYGAHRLMWECIMKLTDEQFTQEVDYSLGSVRNHMVHLISVDSRWLARMQGQPLPPALDTKDYAARETTRAKWNPVEAAMMAFIGQLSEQQLSQVITYDMPHRGGVKHDPLWQILAHVVNHGTDHRAQMLPILHRVGAPTFEQDMMIYWWQNKG